MNERKQLGAQSHRKCGQNGEECNVYGVTYRYCCTSVLQQSVSVYRARIHPTYRRTYRFASESRVQEICNGSTKVSCTVQYRHSTPYNPILYDVGQIRSGLTWSDDVRLTKKTVSLSYVLL